MNNLFYAFKITIAGTGIDNKKFYNYEGFDPSNTATPTDAETETKGKAYIRFKHVERMLSELMVPVYVTLNFATPGTMSTVPTDAEFVVGYMSIEPFLSTLETYPEEDQKFIAAAGVIKEIIETAMNSDLTEFMDVQKIIERTRYPVGAAPVEKYREVFSDYLTSAASSPTVTVTHIEL